MKTLREAFASKNIKPVLDSKTTWLRIHRPSVALMLCICSGPWRIERRRKVQENALRILGKRDLTDLSVYDIKRIAQVDWQFQMLTSIVDHMKSMYPRHGFDSVFCLRNIEMAKDNILAQFLLMFATTSPRTRNRYKNLDALAYHARLLERLPKVLGMFVRDFIFYDVFPVDRHVKRWMKEQGLPSRASVVLDMFRNEKLKARYYARALFLDKAGNPMHPATKTV